MMHFKRRVRSQKEINAIVRQYTSTKQTVTALKEKHNLSGSDLYRMIDRAGVGRRDTKYSVA
jgi:hypothetical protein